MTVDISVPDELRVVGTVMQSTHLVETVRGLWNITVMSAKDVEWDFATIVNIIDSGFSEIQIQINLKN